jgi:hypothetical protein
MRANILGFVLSFGVVQTSSISETDGIGSRPPSYSVTRATVAGYLDIIKAYVAQLGCDHFIACELLK